MTDWFKRWNIMLFGKGRLTFPTFEGMKGVQAVAVYVSVTRLLPIF